MPELPAIPMLELAAEHAVYRGELLEAIEAVVDHGQYIGGPEVKAFEEEAAAYLGTAHAIGCNSGTDALVLALRALGVGPGTEVVTTPFTFFATCEAVSAVGAEPVFVDIDPDTFNIDVEQACAAVTDRTSAVIPVHLYGQPAELAPLLALGVPIVEDTAQAFGARYGAAAAGTLGAAGAFSFFPSKTLGGMGDGGMVTTADDDVADRCRMLRSHGSRRKYHNEAIGYNSRLDTIQAAVLRVKLRRVDDANKARGRVAERYDLLLRDVAGVTTPTIAPGRTHVFHQYTVRIADGKRDAVQEALAAQQIASMVYYPVPCHQLPIYAGLGYHLPHAEQAAAEVLSLPISPAMPDESIERVVDALAEAIGT